MLGQSKTVFQAEIDAASEMVDFWRFNPLLRAAALRRAAAQPVGRVERGRVPAARRLRLRGDAVQLHLDRRQPADGAGADGQHRRLEAVGHGDFQRLLHHAAARGVRPAARCHQLRARRPGADLRDRADVVGAGGRALHRQHGGVQRHVEDGRQQHGPLPELPAPGRRDRRQGLHPGPHVGRGGGAGGGHRPRRIRVPGAEVLGREPRLRAGVALARRARPRRGDDARHPDRRRRRLPHVHGRGHRPQGARRASAAISTTPAATPASSRAPARTTTGASSSSRRWSRRATRPTGCCRRRSSVRSSRPTSTRTRSGPRR